LTDGWKVIRNFGIGHGLYTPAFGGGYLADVKEDFANYFSQLNPKGYYFPEGIQGIFLDFDGEGTRFGDYIHGTGVGDRINGLEGNDILKGLSDEGFGGDRLIGGSGWDILDGGSSGGDEASYEDSPNGITVHQTRFLIGDNSDKFAGGDIYKVDDGYGYFDYLISIERISGSNHHDVFWGGYGKDQFYGRDGSDDFIGEGGDDLFDGGKGDDNFWGGDGNDTFDEGFGDSGNDYFDGGSGTDYFYGDNGNDTAFGGADNDFLYGEGDDDWLIGEGGNDYAEGGLGNDHFFGGEGDDTATNVKRDEKAWQQCINYHLAMDKKALERIPGTRYRNATIQNRER